MKIAHILPNTGVGGAQTATYAVIEGMPRFRHYIMTSTQANYKAVDATYMSGDHIRMLNDIRPEIIVYPGIKTNPRLEFSKLEYTPREILWVGHTVGTVPLCGCTKYACVSEYMKAETDFRSVRVAKDLVHVVGNSVRNIFFDGTRSHFNNKCVGRACNVSTYKFHRDYIKTVSHVPSKPKCLIIGGGDYADMLRIQSKMFRISRRTVITGALDHSDVMHFLKQISVFYHHTSTWIESWNLSMCEAMTYGIPVVCDRKGAHTEIVEDGTTGFIIKSVEEALSALTLLTSNGGLWNRISRSAVEYAHAHFKPEVTGRKYEEVLGI